MNRQGAFGTTRPLGPPTASERWFRVGADLARLGRYSDAVEPLEQAMAYSLNDAHPDLLRPLRSFYGLALALGAGDWGRGRRLCEDAIADGTLDPELYVNLARVYLQLGRRDLAIEALETARAVDPEYRLALQLLQQVGQRRPPVFSFLTRSNPLNRLAGKLRHRLKHSERQNS